MSFGDFNGDGHTSQPEAAFAYGMLEDGDNRAGAGEGGGCGGGCLIWAILLALLVLVLCCVSSCFAS